MCVRIWIAEPTLHDWLLSAYVMFGGCRLPRGSAAASARNDLVELLTRRQRLSSTDRAGGGGRLSSCCRANWLRPSAMRPLAVLCNSFGPFIVRQILGPPREVSANDRIAGFTVFDPAWTAEAMIAWIMGQRRIPLLSESRKRPSKRSLNQSSKSRGDGRSQTSLKSAIRAACSELLSLLDDALRELRALGEEPIVVASCPSKLNDASERSGLARHSGWRDFSRSEPEYFRAAGGARQKASRRPGKRTDGEPRVGWSGSEQLARALSASLPNGEIGPLWKRSSLLCCRDGGAWLVLNGSNSW